MNNSSNSSRRFGNTKQISPAKHWCFTYNNYRVSDINDIILIISSNSSRKYVFQEEQGANGTKHLQGYIQFEKKVRPKGIFPKHPGIHWETTRNIKASIVYCTKDETKVGERYSNIRFDKAIRLIDEASFYPWQRELVDLVGTQSSERDIYWYYEYTGNTGKTAITKWLAVKKQALVLSGKATDMKYGIIKFKEKNGFFPDIIIFDIPRSSQQFVSWAGIEEIKNGMFFSAKYESDMVVFDNPHVICFANEEPDYTKLSKDRWQVKHIRRDGRREE
uniref:Putative replication-associated protein n=1 Tax=uncultured virus TaxID=340016 RepID=A0A2H4YQ34_9VIRU|nr:putative replication-associated protein [uncultured virus]